MKDVVVSGEDLSEKERWKIQVSQVKPLDIRRFYALAVELEEMVNAAIVEGYSKDNKDRLAVQLDGQIPDDPDSWAENYAKALNRDTEELACEACNVFSSTLTQLTRERLRSKK